MESRLDAQATLFGPEPLTFVRDCRTDSAIAGPREAAAYFHGVLADVITEREAFVLLTLDAKCQPLRLHLVHLGTIDRTLVSTRDVLRLCLIDNAVQAIVCHNHPSGNPEPSPEDVQVTRTLSAALANFQVDLRDHIIVGQRNGTHYVSLQERGLMPL